MHFLCELFRSRIIKFYVIWLKNVVFRLFAHSFRPRPPFNPIFSFSLKTHSRDLAAELEALNRQLAEREERSRRRWRAFFAAVGILALWGAVMLAAGLIR